MRTSKLLSIGAVIILLMLTLVACLGNDDPTPAPRRTLNVLDNAVGAQDTLAAATSNAIVDATLVYQQTLSAYQTVVAPPTQAPIIRRSPQPSPTATDDPVNDILGNIVYPGDWLTQPFTGTDGLVYSFSSFEGKIIVLMPMSLDCIPCQEQLGYARQTDHQFRTDGVAYELVYINLDTSPSNSMDDLITWSDGQAFESTENSTWLTGTASPELITALNQAFGGSAINLGRTPVILIDKRGQGHTAGTEGMLGSSRLRDVIVFYDNPPNPAELSGDETGATEETATP
ncbi:MAG: hypothetical protein HY862_18630 [Chloroflexi bacterium]|nr:hypothetical protein [Chloroflexota bacterium]